MSRFLMIDVGAGTMDVLYYNTQTDLHYKAVVKSPVRHLAEKVLATPGDLLVTGCEMGGGPITKALRERARTANVVVSAGAAATLHHDLDKVRSWNIRVVSDEDARELSSRGRYSELNLGDLDPVRLEQIVGILGVPFEFDAVAACAQDHGVPPDGVSHLDFRHNMFESRLNENPLPHTLLYSNDEVPAAMTRLSSMARTAQHLPTNEVYVMDSGMAAILGASMDVRASGSERVFVLDVATSHTVGAAMVGNELAGFFEYHTVDVTAERLESLFRDLDAGRLDHRQVLQEGGHGAYTRRAVGSCDNDVIIATGPKRRLVDGSTLPVVFGAPLGDNMMTGTVGLLEAVRRRKGLAPIRYI